MRTPLYPIRAPPPRLCSPAPTLAELEASGRLCRWRREGARSLPGEVGSGYKSSAADYHVEPEEIYVLGTSHASAQSAAEVEAAIAALRPDAVVVELCRSRASLLNGAPPASGRAPNPFGVTGDGGGWAPAAAAGALVRSIALGGWVAWSLRLVLAASSRQLADDTGSAVGADFAAAARGAREVGAELVLGDRPVEITLERAWLALSAGEKRRLLELIAGSLRPPPVPWARRDAAADEAARAREAEAEKAAVRAAVARGLSDEDDALQRYEAVLASEFPSLGAPLLRERDIYLSLTLRSSLAVSGKARILGVIGRGHLPGVMRALDEGDVHRGQFKALTWTPRRARAKQKLLGVVPRPLAERLATDLTLGLAVWWVLR